MAEAVASRRVPIVAVTPIIGGAAVKGPAAKMMAELGVPPSASAIAAHYGASIDGFVIDAQDAAEADAVETLGTPALVVPTLMRTADDERRLAEDTLRFARALRPRDR
jgi:LPPG:FO 2-phospho-L-lactate transferase